MKTLHSKYYKYLGNKCGWHLFKCTKSDFDPEVLMLRKARVILADGKSKFYDEVNPFDADLSILNFNHDSTCVNSD